MSLIHFWRAAILTTPSLRASGLSPPLETSRRARRADLWRRDVRAAASRWSHCCPRRFCSAPTYAVVSMATLALVIGAASAVLAVVNATMIRPLPFPDGDRIVQVFSLPPGVSGVAQRNPLHTRVFFRFRSGGVRLVDALEGISARERVLGAEGEPESVSGAACVARHVRAVRRCAACRPHLERRRRSCQRASGGAQLWPVAAAFRRGREDVGSDRAHRSRGARSDWHHAARLSFWFGAKRLLYRSTFTKVCSTTRPPSSRPLPGCGRAPRSINSPPS